MTTRIDRPASGLLGGVLLGGVLLAGSLLLAPTAAQAAPVVTEAGASCTVTDGTLTWGVKESFRSYISGSIANGSWEASEGATYETPSFQWGAGTGSIDPETGVGSVSFSGLIQFTGHDGVLDLTLANPTLDFEGDGRATLSLDARSTDSTGVVTIDASQEWLGDIEAPSPLPLTETGVSAEAMPNVLTNGGAKAFGGFYEGGADLDPVDVALVFDNCDLSGAAASAEQAEDTEQSADTPETAQVAPTSAEPQIPWIPIIVGGVAILVIGVTAGMLLSGRKRTDQAQPSTPADPGI